MTGELGATNLTVRPSPSRALRVWHRKAHTNDTITAIKSMLLIRDTSQNHHASHRFPLAGPGLLGLVVGGGGAPCAIKGTSFHHIMHKVCTAMDMEAEIDARSRGRRGGGGG